MGEAQKILLQKLISQMFEYYRQKKCKYKYLTKESISPGNYYSLNAFDYYKCIFVHIPKAAGVSINKALFVNLAGGHYSIKHYEKIYHPKTFNKYFKFTFIRHPFGRLFSAYNFLKQGGFDEFDRIWAEENILQFRCYEHFVKEWVSIENIYKKEHFTPQFEYLILKDGNLGVNFIGRVENIENDFEFICKKLGINAKLEHLNKYQKIESYYIDKEMERIIRTVYEKDFYLLNNFSVH